MSSFEFLSAASLALVLAQVPGTQAPPVTAEAHLLVEFTAGEGDALRGQVEHALLALVEDGEVAEAVLAQNETQRRAFWRLRESVPAAEKALGGSIKHDVSVRVDRLPALARRAGAAVLARVPKARLSIYGHVGDGNLHFNVLAPVDVAAEDFRAAHGEAISALVHGVAQEMDGSFSAEHGVGRLKRDLLAAAEGPVAMDLMRGLKQAFDPLGLMNPGKVL